VVRRSVAFLIVRVACVYETEDMEAGWAVLMEWKFVRLD
jgi:hypothetical protein